MLLPIGAGLFLVFLNTHYSHIGAGLHICLGRLYTEKPHRGRLHCHQREERELLTLICQLRPRTTDGIVKTITPGGGEIQEVWVVNTEHRNLFSR